MPHRSRINVQYVKHLQRQGTRQLYLSLSRQAAHVARRGTEVHRKSSSGRFTEPLSEASTIDTSMLSDLASALHGKVGEDDGEQLFEAIWRRIKRRVCDDFDLCNKWQGGDPGLALAILNFIARGQPITDHTALVLVIVLAMRLGPEWMCDCSRRKKG